MFLIPSFIIAFSIKLILKFNAEFVERKATSFQLIFLIFLSMFLSILSGALIQFY
jgi:hypothetical protein